MQFKNNKFIYTIDALMSNPQLNSFYTLFTKPAGEKHSGFVPENHKDTDSVSFLWTLSKEERKSLGDSVLVLRFLRVEGAWDVSSFNMK